MHDQRNRMLRLRSPLGDEACVVTGFSGTDRIGDVYRYQVSLQVKNHAIHAQDIVGLAVTLELTRHAVVRYFHGVVESWAELGMDADGTARYRLDIVPRMALLKYARHNRIFENRSTVDIVQLLLGECGEKFDISRLQSYTSREICTQYDETDLDFIFRLLRQEGIAFFFIHEKDSCTCVLVDSPSGFGTASPDVCDFVPAVGGMQHDAISDWRRLVRLGSTRLTSIDCGEYAPALPLVQNADSGQVVRNRDSEVQLFGQHQFQRQSVSRREFDIDSAARQVARWQACADAETMSIDGAGNIAGLGAGMRVLVKNARPNSHERILITCIHHDATDGNAESTFYRNAFSAVDAAAGYFPAGDLSHSGMAGTHSATVVEVKDPSSDGAHAEVRVKFPWEQNQASCWARVVQLSAGNRWGSYFMPEPGQEVLVEFINGDPDRPVVVGALYNRDHKLPPYTRTQSGVRTRSRNFSELRFDDCDGSEEVFFQAGRDHNYLVNNDETGTIANNRRVTICNGNDETSVRSGNQSTTVAGSISVVAGQSITLQVGGSSICIEPACITLHATMISLRATAQVEIEGGAVTDIDGAIVRINS